jgi:hypothetical protein
MSAANLLKVPEEDRTLCHARGFLDHSVSCNSKFTGTGRNPTGQVKMLTRNRPIKDIEGHSFINLKVTKDDLDAQIKKEIVRLWADIRDSSY